MTQRKVVERAKGDNLKVISKWLNHSLPPDYTVSKIVLKDGCLKLLLSSSQTPDRKISTFISQGIAKLGIESLETLDISGMQAKAITIAWNQKFDLNSLRMNALKEERETKTKLANELSLNSEELQSKQELRQLAQPGDIELISALVNRLLESKQLQAKVSLENQTLKVVIETKHFLDVPPLAAAIGKELNDLASDAIKVVELYKQREWNTKPYLLRKIELVKQENKPQPDAQDSETRGLRDQEDSKDQRTERKSKILQPKSFSPNRPSNVTERVPAPLREAVVLGAITLIGGLLLQKPIADVFGVTTGVIVLTLLFRPVFGNVEGFLRSVSFFLTPDLLSWFQGQLLEDRVSELKLFLWLMSGGLAGFVVYYWLS